MRPRYLPMLLLAGLLLPCLMGGCGDQVREDRQIAYSSDGQTATFQHGAEGVFITDTATGQPQKIFTPDERILATSTPLWSPDQTRVLFTTAAAKYQDQNSVATADRWDEAPSGRRFLPMAITYTCWMWEQRERGEDTEAIPLFQANCLHSGYVAANLAIRWRSDGQRIFYIDQTGEAHHGLFEFDLQTQQSGLIFPYAVMQFAFDLSPDGNSISCAIESNDAQKDQNGIWIGRSDGRKWWRVSDSATGLKSKAPALNRLLETRPVWSPSSRQFAFMRHEITKHDNNEAAHALLITDAESRETRRLLEDETYIKDVRWSPDESRLGAIVGEKLPQLKFIDLKTSAATPLSDRAVRQFIGWDATGSHLAYVAPENRFAEDQPYWAFLFIPRNSDRDEILLAPADGSAPGQSAFSGMRLTFPHWSPTEQKISLWATFTPKYRSLISTVLPLWWGLRPGDPAAILNTETGEIQWKPVNAFEKAQIGHYYLYQREYATALKWYEQANDEWPPTPNTGVDTIFNPFTGPQTFAFFHAYCLNKLGREAEAEAVLVKFNQSLIPEELNLPGAANPEDQEQQRQIGQLLDPHGAVQRLVRDLYIAEVYLSLDAINEAEQHFREALNDEMPEKHRLVDAITLAQLLLLQQKTTEYASLVTESIAPLMTQQIDWENYSQEDQADSLDRLVDHMAVATVVPLLSREMVYGLPLEKLKQWTTAWERLREQVDHDMPRLGCDLFLREAYRRLERAEDLERVEAVIAQNPFLPKVLPAAGVNGLIAEWRTQIAEAANSGLVEPAVRQNVAAGPAVEAEAVEE